MKKYNKKFKKEKIKEKNNNSISISHNKSTIIKNWRENDLEYSLNSKEIERYEKKNTKYKRAINKRKTYSLFKTRHEKEQIA